MDIEQFIRDNYLTVSDKKIGEVVGYSAQFVNKYRAKLGLESPRSTTIRGGISNLQRSGECYELWINGTHIQEIAKQIKVSHGTVSKMIERFLPYRGDNKIELTLQSKANAD